MTITVADFNNVRTKLVNTFGGSPNAGGTSYGQQLDVANVPAVSQTQITNVIWNGLGNDLRKARQHQTGVIVTNSELPTLSKTTIISNTIYQQFVTLANTVEANKFTLATTGIAQRSIEILPASTFATAWNTALYSRIVVTFPGYSRSAVSNVSQAVTVSPQNHARAFFNAGGEIRFRASRTGANLNTKDTDWTNLLAAMGTIRFRYNATSTSPDAAASSPGTFPLAQSGFYVSPAFTTISMPTSNTISFFKTGSTYATNRYQLSYRANNASDPTSLTFIIAFLDNAVGGPSVDETVSGTITSTIEFVRPSGSSVDVPSPSYTITNLGTTVLT